MCNNSGSNMPFVADYWKVRFGDREYKVKVFHYHEGKEFNDEFLSENVKDLIEDAKRMKSKRLTVAWVDAPNAGKLVGSAFCKRCPEDSGAAKEGRLRAKDRLRTIVEFLGGSIVWPEPEPERVIGDSDH